MPTWTLSEPTVSTTTVADLHSGLGKRIETAVDDALPYLNKAVWLIAKRLYSKGSKLICSDLDIDFTATSSEAALPSDFAGLMGRLYIDGYKYPIDPCPSDSTRIYYEGEYVTIPNYYEIIGLNIKLIPGVTAASTLKGHYFAKPEALTSTTDAIPWNTRFDDILGEYLVEATKLNPIPESEFQSLINSGVDDYISRMERRAAPKPGMVSLRGYFR